MRGAPAIIAAYTEASAEVRAAGASWYPAAAAECRDMLPADPERAAAIVAALSPRLSWRANLLAARAVVRGETPRGVLRANVGKAQRIAAGADPDVVLGGPKVRAFYRALVGDRDAVVVDVWAARVAGVAAPDTERRYHRAAASYRIAARTLGVPVAHVQAATWIHARGTAA